MSKNLNMKPKLFLLKPDFTDNNSDTNGKLYYCPHCAMIEGVLHYYPELKNLIDVQYVDFQKPRQAIIDLIGEENQSCPVLIVDFEINNKKETSYFNRYENKLFVNSTELISRYFSEKFGTGNLH